MAIQILEQYYTLRMTEGELRTLLKAVRSVELYEGQGPEILQGDWLENEIAVLRKFRADADSIVTGKR